MSETIEKKKLWEELRDLAAPNLARALKVRVNTMKTDTLAAQIDVLAYHVKRGTPENTVLADFCRAQASKRGTAVDTVASYLQTAAFCTPEDDIKSHEKLAEKFRSTLEKADSAHAYKLAGLARVKLSPQVPLAFEAASFLLNKAGQDEVGPLLENIARESEKMSPKQHDRLIGMICKVSFKDPSSAAEAFKEMRGMVPFGSSLDERIDIGLDQLSQLPEVKFESERRKYGMVLMTPDEP